MMQEAETVSRIIPLRHATTSVAGEPRQRRGIRPAVIMSAVVVVGAALRIVGITHQSIWLDEAFSVYLSAHRYPTILDFIAGSDAHPPLYYLVLHTWMVLGSSVLVLRMLSALASIATLVMLYLLGRRLANPRVALLATAFMAISAFQVWYAQEVRMYALTTLAVVIAVYGLVRAWHQGGMSSWVLFTGGMLAAIYLDYSAFYVYSALILWFLRVGARTVERRKPFVLSNIVIFLGYLPWLPVLWRQIVIVGTLTSWIDGSNGSGVVGALTDLFFNRTNLLQSGSNLAGIVAGTLSLTVVGVALVLSRQARAYSLLAYWFGWPCLLGLTLDLLNHPVVIARQLMVVQPALFLLLALASEHTWKRLPNGALSRFRVVIFTVLLGTFIIANISAQVTSWTTTLKEDWRAAATIVATHQQPGGLILFNAYFVQMPFDYYFHSPEIRHDRIVERGYQTEESLLYADLASTGTGVVSGTAMSGYTAVWLVVSHAGTPTAGAAVPPWLNSHYHLVRQWDLAGVSILLFEPFT